MSDQRAKLHHEMQHLGMRPFAAEMCSVGARGSAVASAAVHGRSVGAWNGMLTVWCSAHTSRCSWVHDWAHEHAPCPRRAASGWDSTAVWRRTDSCALLSPGERV